MKDKNGENFFKNSIIHAEQGIANKNHITGYCHHSQRNDGFHKKRQEDKCRCDPGNYLHDHNLLLQRPKQQTKSCATCIEEHPDAFKAPERPLAASPSRHAAARAGQRLASLMRLVAFHALRTQLDVHAGGSAASPAAKTCSMNATNSAQLIKCVAWPDITCSARPRGPSGTPSSAAATCTTKARWAGNRDWDDRCVCTCLSPLRWTMLHMYD